MPQRLHRPIGCQKRLYVVVPEIPEPNNKGTDAADYGVIEQIGKTQADNNAVAVRLICVAEVHPALPWGQLKTAPKYASQSDTLWQPKHADSATLNCLWIGSY